MPNGFHGSEKRWLQLSSPLLACEDIIETFAQTRELSITRDYHNWPSRALRWTSEIERKIEVALDSLEEGTFRVAATAWADEEGSRYWRHEAIGGPIAPGDLRLALPLLLETAYQRLRSWARSDLAFAAELTGG